MAVGEEAAERLRKSSVLVVGLGGVGGYAAEMLVRAGIGTITIADGDKIHPWRQNSPVQPKQTAAGSTEYRRAPEG